MCSETNFAVVEDQLVSAGHGFIIEAIIRVKNCALLYPAGTQTASAPDEAWATLHAASHRCIDPSGFVLALAGQAAGVPPRGVDEGHPIVTN